MTQRIKRQDGAVLIFSLLTMVVLMTISGAVTLRAVFETNMARRDVAGVKAHYLSEAGINSGLDGIHRLVNQYAYDTVNKSSPALVVTKAQDYAVDGKAIRFLCWALKNNGNPLYTCPADADPDPESLTYVQSTTEMASGETYDYQIVFSEKKAPEKIGEMWLFHYGYTVAAQGLYSGVNKSSRLTGDFTMRVHLDNFAKFALFTNAQTMPNGTNVWFTGSTRFAGPVHTNDRFNFYGNPGSTFTEVVSQVQQTARFYNNGSSVLRDDDHNGTRDVPVFDAGFDRGVENITFSSAIVQQDMVNQASGNEVFGVSGVYLPNSPYAEVIDGKQGVLKGGIFVKGDATVSMAVDANNNAKYTIVQGGANHQVTVDRLNNQTIFEKNVAGVVDTKAFAGVPDGSDGVGTIMYVDGQISDLRGTIQEDTQLTIASTGDMVIQGDILYSDYYAAQGTPGQEGYVPPKAEGKANLLGLVTWNGDVVVGTSAPSDVEIHGTILAQKTDGKAVLRVDGYDNTSVGPRGTATLLGGVITQRYGAFGQFNGSTGQNTSGYGRNFVYDQRMRMGKSPPYFPSLKTFIAYTNDITDKLIWF